MPQKATHLIPKDRHDEKSTLFYHVDTNTTSILFQAKGVASLFPRKFAAKVQVNFSLLKFYLNNYKDTRPLTLEAFLTGKIDHDDLISLFLLQESILEFWPVSKRKKNKNIAQLFSIHANGKLTLDTEERLLPYLTSIAPAYAIRKKTDVEFFKLTLTKGLSELSAVGNFFALIDLPPNEILKLTCYLLSPITVHENIFNEELYRIKPLLKVIANTLLNLELNYEDEQGPYQLTEFIKQLDKKVRHILESEYEEKITKYNLYDFLFKKATLYFILGQSGLVGPGDFLPIHYTENGRSKFALIIINSRIQDIWLEAITGKKFPQKTIKKVAMLNDIPLSLEDYGIDAKMFMPYKKYFNTYSTSLCVFMCMLILQEPVSATQITDLCNKIHALETRKVVQFKWNKKDGLMFDVPSELLSFRFRYPEKI